MQKQDNYDFIPTAELFWSGFEWYGYFSKIQHDRRRSNLLQERGHDFMRSDYLTPASHELRVCCAAYVHIFSTSHTCTHTTPHHTTHTHRTQSSVYHDHWRREQIHLLHDLVQCSKVLYIYNIYIYYNINDSLSIYNHCNSWAYQRAS